MIADQRIQYIERIVHVHIEHSQSLSKGLRVSQLATPSRPKYSQMSVHVYSSRSRRASANSIKPPLRVDFTSVAAVCAAAMVLIVVLAPRVWCRPAAWALLVPSGGSS